MFRWYCHDIPALNIPLSKLSSCVGVSDLKSPETACAIKRSHPIGEAVFASLVCESWGSEFKWIESCCKNIEGRDWVCLLLANGEWASLESVFICTTFNPRYHPRGQPCAWYLLQGKGLPVGKGHSQCGWTTEQLKQSNALGDSSTKGLLIRIFLGRFASWGTLRSRTRNLGYGCVFTIWDKTKRTRGSDMLLLL